MIAAYEIISSIWKNFPKKLQTTPLKAYVDNLQKYFEDKNILYNDFLTKIVIIGNVSAGKSSIINALMERNVFQSQDGRGTACYFYVFPTKKQYEYFNINGTHEVKDIDILWYAIYARDIPDYINLETIINVYLNSENINLLKHHTVIVDCPGLEQELGSCETNVEHCSNANIIIFVLDIRIPATPKQKEYIQNILANSQNVSILFVYNKCDTINYDTTKMKELKMEFIELFDNQFKIKTGNDPLYFISSINASSKKAYNEFCEDEFKRFKNDLLNHKNINFIRLRNVLAHSSQEIKSFLQNIDGFLETEINKKLQHVEKYDLYIEKLNQIDTHWNNLHERLRIINKESTDIIKEKKFINIISSRICQSNASCTKFNARNMIFELADNIDEMIRKSLQDHLEKYWYEAIKFLIEKDILKNRFKQSDFILDQSKTFMITDMDLNIFWFFEYGDKTDKVKDSYMNFVKIRKSKIEDSINNFYESQLSIFKKTIEREISDIKDTEFQEKENLHKKVKDANDLVQTLEKYKDECEKLFKQHESSLIL